MGLHRRISALHSPLISALPVTSSHPTKFLILNGLLSAIKDSLALMVRFTPSGVSLSKVQAQSQNLNYACTSIKLSTGLNLTVKTLMHSISGAIIIGLTLPISLGPFYNV